MSSSKWPRIYYFVSGLLYPGALGVALIWLVLAAFAYVNPSPVHPTAWSIVFALWFMLYHSLLFVRLIDRHDRWSSDPDSHPNEAYGGWALASDFIDSLAMFLAFGALGFNADRAITSLESSIVFFAALGVPISALIAKRQGGFGTLRGVLISIAIVLSLIGGVMNLCGSQGANWLLLILLWVMFLIYVVALYSNDS
jgi:hypothetical protein